METIFGVERASLKKAISQGGEIEPTLERLFSLNAIRPTSGGGTGERTGSSGGQAKAQPRALWSTSIGSHPSHPSSPGRTDPSLSRSSSGGRAALPTPPTPTRAAAAALRAAVETGEGRAQPTGGKPAGKKSTVPIVLGVGLVLAGLGVVAAVGLRGERSFSDSSATGVARAAATLELKSQPPGAHVFVDGSPSGLRTPAKLTGLAAGSRIQVRLDKSGYEPVTEQVTLAAGQTRTLSLVLKGASGNLKIVGAPARATIYLDDHEVDATKPLSAPSGAHKLRVETADGVLFSKTIEVAAGAEVAVDVAQQRSRE
jgi:hypothetical protein